MKVFVFLMALSLVSCQKKSCYKCTIQTYRLDRPYTPDEASVSYMGACEQTEKEINEYIKWSENQMMSSSAGPLKNKTTCVETKGL